MVWPATIGMASARTTGKATPEECRDTTIRSPGSVVPLRPSALTLRLWLALFGLVTCTGFSIWLAVLRAPAALVVVLALLAVVALVDIGVIVRRKRRGEPG